VKTVELCRRMLAGSREDKSSRADAAHFKQTLFVTKRTDDHNHHRACAEAARIAGRSGLFVMPPNRIIEYRLDWRNGEGDRDVSLCS